MRKITAKDNNLLLNELETSPNNSTNGTYNVNRNKPIGINRKILLIISFAKISKHIIEKIINNNPSINPSKVSMKLLL